MSAPAAVEGEVIGQFAPVKDRADRFLVRVDELSFALVERPDGQIAKQLGATSSYADAVAIAGAVLNGDRQQLTSPTAIQRVCLALAGLDCEAERLRAAREGEPLTEGTPA